MSFLFVSAVTQVTMRTLSTWVPHRPQKLGAMTLQHVIASQRILFLDLEVVVCECSRWGSQSGGQASNKCRNKGSWLCGPALFSLVWRC